MAKNWWQEDDEDDDDDWGNETEEEKLQRERAEMRYDLELRGVCQDTLAQKFCEICGRQKGLDDDKLLQRGRLASEIEKDLAWCEKQRNKLFQDYSFSCELESIVENNLNARRRDSHSAWQGLQRDIEWLERTLCDYENRGDKDAPEYKQYEKKLKVMNTLAKMRTIEEVEQYLKKHVEHRQEIEKQIDECNRKIGMLNQELDCVGKTKISAQVQKEWNDEEVCLMYARKEFAKNMRDFAFACPQNELVKNFQKLLNDVFFFSTIPTIQTMSENNLEFVVKQVAGKKVKNYLEIQKKTDTGR